MEKVKTIKLNEKEFFICPICFSLVEKNEITEIIMKGGFCRNCHWIKKLTLILIDNNKKSVEKEEWLKWLNVCCAKKK